MLQIDNLHAYYGKSHVLHGVNFEVGQGEIVALLGRNGSGRSTTAKAIMGLVECEGRIDWKGQAIQGKKAYEIAHLGVGYVPENREIFPKLTLKTCSPCFLASRSGNTTKPGCSRAENSKCSPCAAP
jgi:branched-chain amino acid transport system ATP-binding protein